MNTIFILWRLMSSDKYIQSSEKADNTKK
jgi:hypothetical protein